MDKKKPANFKILDCTIRDGGYLNNWRFDKKVVREVYRALSKSGVDYVEIGFRGTEKYFDRKEFGPWRFTDVADLKEAVTGITGAKLAIMGDYGKFDAEDMSDEYCEFVDLVRVAVHKDNTLEAIRLLQTLKQKGYNVSLNAMGITGYSKQELTELAVMLADSEIDYIYIADSYGSILPDGIAPLVDPFRDLPYTKVGFHPHNSLQMAFANTLEAIKCGVDIIDCTIYGMGRGAGNLPTEVILSYLQLSTSDKYNVIPVLHAIDRFFTDIEVDEPWGYQLPYMLSGIFQCHPYFPKTLVDYREYSMEDIWNALEVIRTINPVGFSKKIVEDVIKSGMIGGNKSSVSLLTDAPAGTTKLVLATESSEGPISVPYAGRHSGRDFLVLASGPTLKEYKARIDRFIERYDPVILGANYLSGLFVPHYHAFNNKKRFVDYVDTVDKASTLLIGQNMDKTMVTDYTNRDYETIYFVDALNSFDIVNDVIQCNCRTISVLLMAVAVVMGARRVFAVGMDGYAGTASRTDFHFYSEKVEPEDRDLITERHRWNQHYIEQICEYLAEKGMEEAHILTPTSHKAFYKGIENYL